MASTPALLLARLVLALAVLLVPGAVRAQDADGVTQAGRAVGSAIESVFGPPLHSRSQRAKPTSKPTSKPSTKPTAKPTATLPGRPVRADAATPLPPARPASAPQAPRVATPPPARSDSAPPTRRVAAVPPARPAAAAPPRAAAAPVAAAPVAEAPVPPPGAATVPLPPPRPGRLAALPPAEPVREPDPVPPPPPAPAATVESCPVLAADGIAVAAAAPQPDATSPTCGVELPVRLAAVRLADGRLVPLEPAALMRCDMAAAVARWVREDVAPAVARLGSPLAKVQVAAGYQCRPRNRVVGAKMSEHGRGNALDTGGYTLEDGRQLRIGGTGANAMPAGFQAQLRASACARFKTILGPGSDGYHEQHLHVDLAPRRSGAVLCQWTLQDLATKQGPDDRGAAAGAAR